MNLILKERMAYSAWGFSLNSNSNLLPLTIAISFHAELCAD
jgi:hypothetical protein